MNGWQLERKEIVDRLREIEDRLAELVPTQTGVEGQPTSLEFSGKATFQEHERLLEEKRKLLAMLREN
jgi:hypothetical protein